MKKLILAAITVTSAVSVLAQGTVNFNQRTSGTSHVYAPLNSSDSQAIIGQGVGDGVPTGATSYGARNIVGLTTAGQYGGNSTWASLLGGPTGTGEGSMIPGSLSLGVGPLLGNAGTAPIATSFRTGAASGGGVIAATASFSNITKDAANADFEVVAWDNFSGSYSTWALASVAWQSGLIAAGKSGIFNLKGIGGASNTAPPLFPTTSFSPGDAVAGQSFSLYFIPEPSSLALAGLGAAALMIFRRRK